MQNNIELTASNRPNCYWLEVPKGCHIVQSGDAWMLVTATASQDPDQEVAVTSKEMARLLSISETTLWRLKAPSFKLLGARRFLPSQVKNFILSKESSDVS